MDYPLWLGSASVLWVSGGVLLVRMHNKARTEGSLDDVVSLAHPEKVTPHKRGCTKWPAQPLITRGLRLEYATLGWNVVGCMIVLASAYTVRSVALAGFGIDSVIEIFASLIVVWQLKRVNKDKEHLAERLIGLAFFLLTTYLTVQSAVVLLTHFHPRTSLLGMVWLGLTCTAMLLLAWGKGTTGRELRNPVLVKESKVTVVDGVLAAAVLLGTGLNALVGLWWADPLAALVIVVYGLRERIGAIRG